LNKKHRGGGGRVTWIFRLEPPLPPSDSPPPVQRQIDRNSRRFSFPYFLAFLMLLNRPIPFYIGLV